MRMMSTCRLCKRLSSDYVVLFGFPNNEEKRKQWAAFCKLNPKEDPLFYVLCSLHFDLSAFRNLFYIRNCRLSLKNTAVPTIFDTRKFSETKIREHYMKILFETKSPFDYCCLCGASELNLPRFRFPIHDPETTEKWLAVCANSNNNINVYHHRVCKKHFEINDFLLRSKERQTLLLKPKVVPSFLPYLFYEFDKTSDEKKPLFMLSHDPPSYVHEVIIPLKRTKMTSKPVYKKVYLSKVCAVDECPNTRNKSPILLYRIPKNVYKNKIELLRWKIALKRRKPFNKHFVICNGHFEKKHTVPPENKEEVFGRLLDTAFPTLNLPQFPKKAATKRMVEMIKSKYEKIRQRKLDLRQRQNTSNDLSNFENVDIIETLEEPISYQDLENSMSIPIQASPISYQDRENSISIGIQASPRQMNKQVQVSDLQYDHLSSMPFQVNTDARLNVMTGIPTLGILKDIVIRCLVEQPSETFNEMEHKVILTLYRIKNNLSNSHVANLFRLSEATSLKYFINSIRLISKALNSLIRWVNREELQVNSLKCFEKFPNVVTVLDGLEIKTVRFKCVKCRSNSCVHCKGMNTVKLLIGFSPSGLVNFISPSVSGRIADKSAFNVTGLLKSLKKGDAIMVGSGFKIGNFVPGVEFIRPGKTKEDVENDRLIASVESHIEKLISHIKSYKMVSEKILYELRPYVDDMVLIICAISNMCTLDCVCIS